MFKFRIMMIIFVSNIVEPIFQINLAKPQWHWVYQTYDCIWQLIKPMVWVWIYYFWKV